MPVGIHIWAEAISVSVGIGIKAIVIGASLMEMCFFEEIPVRVISEWVGLVPRSTQRRPDTSVCVVYTRPAPRTEGSR